MGLIPGVPLITIILTSMLVLRQLTREKKSRRSPEAMLSVEDVPPGDEYEVFLSFRGSDTRNNFTDCLYHELRRVGFHVFRDNEELRIGEKIDEEIFKALNKSQIYIPIFSRNYATSSWCLRELAYMVECTSDEKKKKKILPIFFDVDPNDVKLKTRLYRKAIPKHKKKFGSDALKRWEDALVEVAHLKAWEVKGKGHGELIKLVVGEVLRKLNARHVDVPEYWVEDHCRMENILEKLKVDSDGVRFLGIHGIGGIGKTVLAKVVFNKISSHFEGVCFLNDVRESLQHGLISVQKKLLASFVGPVNADQIKDIGDGMNQIKRVCHNQKVLIVLDDLDKQEQLKKLAGKSDWFGSGSRIIFTTRNLEVLMTQVESSSEDVLSEPRGTLAYEVHEMEFAQAVQLFCKHAFRRDSPPEGYDHLSEKIVLRVGMLPLAVEAIGSFLYCHGSTLEQHCDKKNLWEDTLKRLDDGPFQDVRDALMISYEGLENKEKEVFLDIACLFTNKDQTYPVFMWHECNYHPHLAISVLCQRSLIKIGHDNKFWMHDQVRDLGKHIMREKYPRKFSRVYIKEDAIKLLERKERNEDVKALCLTSDICNRNFQVEGTLKGSMISLKALTIKEKAIFLDVASFYINSNQTNPVISTLRQRILIGMEFDNELWMHDQVTSDSCSRNIGPKELDALSGLRFLQVEGIDFIGNCKNDILELRWLSLEGTHNKFCAGNFHSTSLVMLDLSRSNIEDDWGGWSQFQMTKKLKVLDLKDCKKLTRTPDVTNFMSLEILVLAGCVSLITIDCSIGKLELRL
ncbi:disease resistance protein RUN1-like isoform X2 [Eucalyptus grandis]|uniref:disease resistance protein RUN1-like isoform X2 n=1 Tax=Eucalyptus grandis TaxID=71139 RepID=UPI00192EA32C|nr:disease resistance protein RUN1-like isoform X2 [Eucalyptus grandis]